MGRHSLVKNKRGGAGGMPDAVFPQLRLRPCSTPVALNMTFLVWGSTTLPIGWSIRSTYEEQMWPSTVQWSNQTSEQRLLLPISATALATPSILTGCGNSPLLNSHHEALGWLLFHNFLTTLKNSNHKTAPRALQKVVLENTSHLLSHPINHFTRRNRLPSSGHRRPCQGPLQNPLIALCCTIWRSESLGQGLLQFWLSPSYALSQLTPWLFFPCSSKLKMGPLDINPETRNMIPMSR